MSIMFVSTMTGDAWGASEELWSQTAAWLHECSEPVNVNIKQSSFEHPVLQQRLGNKACFHLRKPSSSALWARVARRIGVLRQAEYECLDRNRFDLVVISSAWQYEGLGWAAACRQRGIPYALLVQHVVADVALSGDRFRLTEALPAFQAAEKCFFVSRANLALMRHQLAWEFPNAQVVRSPLNSSRLENLVWPERDGIVRIATVARLDPLSKGLDILFQVLSQAKWKNRPLTVSLFGEGPHKKYLEQLMEYYQLTQVRLEGFVEDIGRVWETHCLMVLPSRSEGLPLAVAEAMLCGRPCVVTPAAGGMGELVVDGDNGFVAAAPTAELLDGTLERAWARRSEWPEMGRRAAVHARKIFPENPERKFADDLLALIRG